MELRLSGPISPAGRLRLALIIGLLSAAICYLRLSGWGFMAADFTWPWRAAQYLLSGENPYLLILPTGEYPTQAYFYYPLTSALLAIPFACLHSYFAGAMFFGFSSALLAFAISKDGWNRLPIFLSAPYWIALMVAQWSPLIVAATLLPWMQWLLVCKPNIGIAGFVYRPTWRGALGSLLFLGLCFLILPSWLKDWLRVSATLESHPPPVFILPFGPLLLLGFLRWRTAPGRLFLAMSLMPQLMFFYDQLILWLIPMKWKTGLLYAGLSWTAYILWRLHSLLLANESVPIEPTQYILALVFLPALVILLWPENRFIKMNRSLKKSTALISDIAAGQNSD